MDDRQRMLETAHALYMERLDELFERVIPRRIITREMIEVFMTLIILEFFLRGVREDIDKIRKTVRYLTGKAFEESTFSFCLMRVEKI
ncbi:MAG: hypothetical protein ACOYS2_02430 [Patescibacteria group bacterium]